MRPCSSAFSCASRSAITLAAASPTASLAFGSATTVVRSVTEAFECVNSLANFVAEAFEWANSLANSAAEPFGSANTLALGSAAACALAAVTRSPVPAPSN
jgi:hypothetical protein